jgi:raffinose/stachyose/melibiose transport system permease protein
MSTEPRTEPIAALSAPPRRRRKTPPGGWTNWLYILPAVVMYATFVLWPLLSSVRYSFYDWNGITAAEWVGVANYKRVLSDSDLIQPVIHAFQLVIFFTLIPVSLGLVAAALIHGSARGRFGTLARTTLFLPQVIPLVAAGIAWKWAYASTGIVNQVLSAIGLERLTRPWLADFDLALPAVGFVGTWVLLGFCTVLLLTGISKIDPSLYEAARIDGAGAIGVFRAITVPSLIGEIGVCVTVSMIAALASFDIIYITTLGGPGTETMVPGVLIYRLAFAERNVGLASAMGVVLMLLVVACVLIVQRVMRGDEG